ncbi:MAG: DUF2849 domain-containing protein [Pseudomonadota bacterium]
MARKSLPVVLTANDLVAGDVVWWTGSGWDRDRARAELFASQADAASMLERLGTDSTAIGVYAVPIDPDTGQPATRREAIRAARTPSFDYLAPQTEAKAAPHRREAA